MMKNKVYRILIKICKLATSIYAFGLYILIGLTQENSMFYIYVIAVLLFAKAGVFIISDIKMNSRMRIASITLLMFISLPFMYGIAESGAIMLITTPDHKVFVNGENIPYMVSIISANANYIFAINTEKKVLVIPMAKVRLVEKIKAFDGRPLFDVQRALRLREPPRKEKN
jgi:hypothetical protein